MMILDVQKPVGPIRLFSKVSERIMIPQRKKLRIPFRELKKAERIAGTIAVGHRGMAVGCAVVRVEVGVRRIRYSPGHSNRRGTTGVHHSSGGLQFGRTLRFQES